MKLYLIKMPPFGYDSGELFTINKWYEGDLTPTMYDPQTLQPEIPSLQILKGYIVKCNDGNYRKVGNGYFITQDQLREIKLNELGIRKLIV